MLISIFLYVIYFSLAVFFFYQSKFINSIGLKKSVVVSLFALKVFGGLLYYYFMTVRFYGGDSHGYYAEVMRHMNNLSINACAELKYFFTEWSEFYLNEHYFSKQNAVSLSDIGSQLNIRIMYLSCILSLGNELVNNIFYNFLFFLGQLALFKALINIAPTKKMILLLIVFFIPSVWFWCSGIHKDGFILSLLGVLLLAMYNWQNTFKTRYFIYMLLALLGLFCIRYYTCLLMLPIWLTYLLTIYFKKYSVWKVYLSGFVIFIIIFFNAHYIIKAIRPAEMVVKKQSEFLTLRGNSYTGIHPLSPNLKSFIFNAPNAMTRVLTRPNIYDVKDIMYLITFLETTLLLVIITILFIFKKNNNSQHSILYFAIISSLIMFLIIGYIVPFSGAFIRYRAAYYPLIIGALYCLKANPILPKFEQKWAQYIFK